MLKMILPRSNEILSEENRKSLNARSVEKFGSTGTRALPSSPDLRPFPRRLVIDYRLNLPSQFLCFVSFLFQRTCLLVRNAKLKGPRQMNHLASFFKRHPKPM